MLFPKYPPVVTLDKRPEIFAVKEIICTEKLHGSNFRLCFPLGMESIAEVRFGQREVDDNEPTFKLTNAKLWFTNQPDLLTRMWETIKATKNGMSTPANAEGVVIRTNPLFRNTLNEWLICKYKWGKYAERTPEKIKLPREATPADYFAAEYVTEGRVINAQGRLADRGTPLKGDMKDMPALLEEILADLHKEHPTEWEAIGEPDGQMKSAVSRVLGPLYRGMIAPKDVT